jgi:integrase
VFSYAPDHRRHCDPDAITHRYAKMTAELGIDTHLHALRHYSATELIAAGVDVRTVAGRLGGTVASAIIVVSGQAGLMRRRPARASTPRSGFAGFRFPPEVITLAVRW